MTFSAARRHGQASSHAQVYRRGGGNDNQSIVAQSIDCVARLFDLSMISAQTRSAFVARENGYTLFRIMLYDFTAPAVSPPTM
jgi:hypothetical protein